MIRLFMGQAKSGKTYTVYEEMKRHIENGKNNETILIVPEQFTLEAEKQFVSHSGMNGILGVEIISFKRLMHRIFEEVGNINQPIITEMGKLMLLRKVFISSEDVLHLYKNAYDKPGFLLKFHELIQELKQNMIVPEDLERIYEGIEVESLLKFKIKDLKTIFEGYENEKGELFFDDEDYYNLLLEVMPTTELLNHSDVWVDGFDSFTVQEYEILSRIAQSSRNLTITVSWDLKQNRGTFNHTDKMVRKILEIGETVKIEVKKMVFDRPFGNERIEHFAENLMIYPYKASSFNNDNIRIIASNNRLSEIETCAIEIVKCVREDGYEWRDIAVVTNALPEYEMAIKRIFNAYDLPYFLDIKASVLSNPLIRFILSLFKAVNEPKKTEHMIQLLKTGYYQLPHHVISAFELYIKQYGIKTYHLKTPFTRPALEGLDLDSIDLVRARLYRTIQPLNQLKSKSTREVISVLYNMLVEMRILEDIDRSVKKFTETHHYDEAQRFTQVWNKTMELFDQLVAIMGDEIVSLDVVTGLLETGFEHMEVGLLPLNEHQILIGSLDRSRAHPIKVLFILGINDGILPEVGSDQQLISETEKEKLHEKGGRFLSDSKMFVDKETFNIYSAVTRPSERLYLSYAKSDAEGAALRASYLISKARKVDLSLKIEHERIYEEEDLSTHHHISTSKSTLRHLAIEMRRAMDGNPIRKDWVDVFKWYCKNEPIEISHLMDALRYDNMVDRINGDIVRSLYDLPIKTSVSRLEEYIQCPFKYFVSTGLKPRPVKNFSLEYPDVGILFHKTLELFGKQIYELGLNWSELTDEVCDEMIGAIVDSMVDTELFRSKFQYQYMIRKLKRVSRRAAKTLTEHLRLGKFVPAAFEMVFSDGMNSVPPIVLTLSNGEKILLRGVIDRIDVLETNGKSYVKIIDYKSGSKQLSLSDIYNGLQMQLMVYLDACLGHPEYFKSAELLPAGAFYFKIDDPMIETAEQVKEMVEKQIAGELKLDGLVVDDINVLKNLDESLYENSQSQVVQIKIKNDGSFTKDSKTIPLESFYDMIHWVKKTIVEVGDELVDGKIDIKPCQSGTFKSCDYCDYKALCQFDTHFESNRFRVLKSYTNEEVLLKVSDGGKNG
ncbi:MAG: helicase-exonuclease AddAB subunit AddB [Clostridia bacterium]|nr:helicase-exonuclease AddAB subunit AddB [Clostridia bacterium]